MTGFYQGTLRYGIRAGDLLGLLGAQVLTTNPDALPPAVADAYLALKRRGQI